MSFQISLVWSIIVCSTKSLALANKNLYPFIKDVYYVYLAHYKSVVRHWSINCYIYSSFVSRVLVLFLNLSSFSSLSSSSISLSSSSSFCMMRLRFMIHRRTNNVPRIPATNAPITNKIASAIENDPLHEKTGFAVGGGVAMFPSLMFSWTVSL